MISSAGRSRARFVCATSSHYRQVLHLVHSRICNALQPQSCLQHAGSLCRAAPRMPMEKRMPQHRPTLVPAIFALPLAASCVVSAGAVHAAECIAKPNAPAQQGKHWYYRTDRATKRQCWYLGSQGASVQKGATQASEQPAPNALAQPAAPQRAHRPTAPQSAQRPTAPELTAALAATEASVPAPAAPLPLPEASELPDVPPAFELAPTPALAERQQSVDAIDPAPTPASDPAKEFAIACERAIFSRHCTRAGHGRRRSHLSAGDDRVRDDCHFWLGVRGHALAASPQGQQSPRTRMGDLEHIIPMCPGVSGLRFKNTGTTHSTAAQAAGPSGNACAKFAANPERVANETLRLAIFAERPAAFKLAAGRHIHLARPDEVIE